MHRAASALFFSALAGSAAAVDIDAVARGYIAAHMSAWTADPLLLAAVQAGNAAHSGLDGTGAPIGAMTVALNAEALD